MDLIKEIVGNAGFNSKYLNGSDSIIVLFDNLYSITHYINTPLLTARKYYLYASHRNLNNKDSYVYTYRDISKQKRETTYTYEFTEQDYLDAK